MKPLLPTALLALFTHARGNTYDYIIVGGGTCGLLLANRLSADPSITVAVIEPGGDTRNNTNVTVPTSWLNNFGSSIDWQYPSIALPEAGNRSFSFSAGKAIGGTSTINGMTYIRADAAEIDAWALLGNTNWTWDVLFPYYLSVENFTAPLEWQADAGATYDPAYHGEAGHLKTGFLDTLPNGSFHAVVEQAWAELGLGQIRDVNGGSTRGFDVWPMTVDRDEDLRWDAAKAYYWPVSGRENLKLVKGTAKRVIWGEELTDDGDLTAIGVELVHGDGDLSVLNATRECILSAGAWKTPPILELSGVGNPRILEKLGIDVKIDLPGVGEHLQDQTNIGIMYQGNTNVSGYATYATFASAQDIFGVDISDVATATQANISLWAVQASDRSGGALSVDSWEKLFQVQHDLIFGQNVTVAEILTFVQSSGVLYSTYVDLLPFSRGNVHLAAKDMSVRDPVVIDPGYHRADFDLLAEKATGKLVQEYWATSPVSGLVVENVIPGVDVLPNPATDAQWESFISNAFGTNNHPIATAAMMSRDLGGVVDPHFCVYGARNLRVVDASVIPMQISGHLTSTLYAMAERASEFISGDQNS